MISVMLGIISPVLLLVSILSLALTDIFFALFGRLRHPDNQTAYNQTASVVIPNWNGRDLLQKYLPSVVAATSRFRGSEVIVVDNASSDGSVEFLQERFPAVRILRLPRNLGFGEGSSAGFRVATNDIVVLLNNDMRVEPDFLGPLLEPFSDPLVFSVSCQIFFSDPLKRREETGLTEVVWTRGRIRPSHRVDALINVPYPCAYPGGGSSAFDRKKFLELGGFDELFHPFYYEDTDLGFGAWKRGWKVLYQPASIVFHEHRGTIGKRFSKRQIDAVLQRNSLLYCWKNIHSWRMLGSHFLACLLTPAAVLLTGNDQNRYTFRGVGMAALKIWPTAKARWRARALSVVTDTEAFRRPLGGYFRDRFQAAHEPLPSRLRILFASPYPIEPPVHGGGVFMKNTLTGLAPFADIHLVSFLDTSDQLSAQTELRGICASTQFFVRNIVVPRNPSTLRPHGIREFADHDFLWALHRSVFLFEIDVLQLEYTVLSQYVEDYQHIPCVLFEHDIFFQSLLRSMITGRYSVAGCLEYLRMLRYELRQLRRFSRVQVCSEENKQYLLNLQPHLKGRLDSDLRNVIDVQTYAFKLLSRETHTLLFIGSFRHKPNVEALNWFTGQVFGRVLELRPEAELVIVGSDPPPAVAGLVSHSNVHLLGFVDDIREQLRKHTVFICPILSGSGIRVKLLEAFASGIPAVSTSIGAEGLASGSEEICELADSPEDFALAVVRLLDDRERRTKLAINARTMMEQTHDSSKVTPRLLQTYREEAKRRRPLLREEPSLHSATYT